MCAQGQRRVFYFVLFCYVCFVWPKGKTHPREPKKSFVFDLKFDGAGMQYLVAQERKEKKCFDPKGSCNGPRKVLSSERCRLGAK